MCHGQPDCLRIREHVGHSSTFVSFNITLVQLYVSVIPSARRMAERTYQIIIILRQGERHRCPILGSMLRCCEVPSVDPSRSLFSSRPKLSQHSLRGQWLVLVEVKVPALI